MLTIYDIWGLSNKAVIFQMKSSKAFFKDKPKIIS